MGHSSGTTALVLMVGALVGVVVLMLVRWVL